MLGRKVSRYFDNRLMPMLLRLLSTVLLVSTVAASTGAQTGSHAGISSIADLDSAAHKVLSSAPQESREAVDWLVRHGDRSSVAVLIQLLRWLPEDREVLAARLETLTGAHVGPNWFDWMVWQQDHPDLPQYPGYAGLARDGQRRGRRCPAQLSLLHLVRLGNLVRRPHPRPGGTFRLRLLRPALSLQQTDVRPTNRLAVGAVHWSPGGGRAYRLQDRARAAASGPELLVAMAVAPPGDARLVARYRFPARLWPGCRLPRVFCEPRADVPCVGQGSSTAPEGSHFWRPRTGGVSRLGRSRPSLMVP